MNAYNVISQGTNDDMALLTTRLESSSLYDIPRYRIDVITLIERCQPSKIPRSSGIWILQTLGYADTEVLRYLDTKILTFVDARSSRHLDTCILC